MKMKFKSILAVAALGGLGLSVGHAATVSWVNAAASTAWLTNANWSTNAFATTGDIAQFNNTGTATTAGINYNGSIAGALSLQAIEVTSLRTRALTISNSSTVLAGVLTLTGGTINSVADVVLSNDSNSLLTLAPNSGGTAGSSIALGDSTNNKISITGTGGITISSVISGASMQLTKIGSGSGVLTLSGVNTYSGGTTVSAGTLAVSGAGTVGTGNVAVASGATLDLSGVTTSYTLSSTQTLSGAGTVALGAKTLTMDGILSAGTGGAGTLAFTASAGGVLSLTSTTAFVFDIGTLFDTITTQQTLALGAGVINFNDFTFNVNGTLNTASPYTLIGGASALTGSLGSSLSGTITTGFNGVISLSGNDVILTVTAVPEPHEYAIAIAGLLGVIILIRRRQATLAA